MPERYADFFHPILDLQTLSENVPGGMFSCRFDDALTLLQYNDAFLSMLGYTREEIHTLFHDSFWNLIDPRDRVSSHREATRQLAKGPNKELAYRITRKDGSTIWVLDKGRLVRDEDGNGSFFCILVDITRNKELESELRLSLERHQIIMDQTTDVIFEWDILSDTLDVSPNWEKQFGFSLSTRNISLYLPTAPFLHEADRTQFLEKMRQIRQGERYCESELRIRRADGSDRWCRIRITGQQDGSGRTVKAVGVVIDIDDEKRRAQALLDSAQRDALTGLYNKAVAQRRIEEALSADPGLCSALFIIDVDNFKGINDTMGHLFGDALLIELSHTLQRQFRPQDVVGRVGGDEFAVYLRDIPNRALAERKAEQILDALSGLSVRERSVGAISCSVGIALTPEHGSTFRELYQRADQALYRAKGSGRDCYQVYDPDDDPDPLPVHTLQSLRAVNERIDSSEGSDAVFSQLIDCVLRILYKSLDLDRAVNTILETVGRQFDVSRAYIFENTEDNRFCCNTFEWCNEGISSQIEHLRQVSYQEDLGGTYLHHFNEDGVFYCQDVKKLPPEHYAILAPQGVKSMLQCAIRDNGQFRGYVGFDECHTNRLWTQSQVDALTFVAEILSTFLLKQRAKERAERNAASLNAILDHQSAWTYVVRSGTYDLLYVNQKLKESVPSARPGLVCHEVCGGSPTPCPFCPIQNLEKNGQNEPTLIFNPYLKVWVSASACRIDWKGEPGILLTCLDVTKIVASAPPEAQ